MNRLQLKGAIEYYETVLAQLPQNHERREDYQRALNAYKSDLQRLEAANQHAEEALATFERINNRTPITHRPSSGEWLAALAAVDLSIDACAGLGVVQ